MKCATLYTRVSTDEQVQGYSLQSQLAAIRRYAVEHEMDVVAEFSEDYTGTVPIEYRPEGKKAFEMLKSTKADAIIVYTMDRLVRPPEEGDEWDTPVLIRSLAKLNKEIHTTDDGQLKTDFASLLIAMLRAKSAGEERRKIIERTTRGRRSKAEEGKVVCSGQDPYGYKYVASLNGKRDSAEIVEHEAEIVRMIYRLYIHGDGAGPLGTYAIANRLTEMGIPTPNKKRAHYRYSSSGVWNTVAINSILSKEMYAGKMLWGVRVGESGKLGKRQRHELLEIPITPIVSQDDFDAAQERKTMNKAMSKRNSKRTYLLRGLIRCGCGYVFTGMNFAKRGYYIYRCTSCVHEPNGVDLCKESSVHGDKLDSLVWDYIRDLLIDPEKMEDRIRAARQEALNNAVPKQNEVEIVEGLIAENKGEAESIAEALKSVKGIVANTLIEQSAKIEERHQMLISKRDALLAELKKSIITDEEICNFTEFSRAVRLGIDKASADDKRRWLEYLRVSGMIQDKKLTLSCWLPVHPVVIDLATSQSC